MARKYSPELRAEVVKAVIDGEQTCAQVARDFNLVAETVRTWVRAAQKEQFGNTAEAREATARARVGELERRVKELENENTFLKKCATFFAKESE